MTQHQQRVQLALYSDQFVANAGVPLRLTPYGRTCMALKDGVLHVAPLSGSTFPESLLATDHDRAAALGYLFNGEPGELPDAEPPPPPANPNPLRFPPSQIAPPLPPRRRLVLTHLGTFWRAHFSADWSERLLHQSLAAQASSPGSPTLVYHHRLELIRTVLAGQPCATAGGWRLEVL